MAERPNYENLKDYYTCQEDEPFYENSDLENLWTLKFLYEQLCYLKDMITEARVNDDKQTYMKLLRVYISAQKLYLSCLDTREIIDHPIMKELDRQEYERYKDTQL